MREMPPRYCAASFIFNAPTGLDVSLVVAVLLSPLVSIWRARLPRGLARRKTGSSPFWTGSWSRRYGGGVLPPVVSANSFGMDCRSSAIGTLFFMVRSLRVNAH